MNYPLNDELKHIENEICRTYTTDNTLSCSIKTSMISSPTKNEFLQLNRNIKKILNQSKNMYIDDVCFEYGKYSRDDVFNKKHEWDMTGIVFTFGIITPFLFSGFCKDSYDYYNSKDYHFITYEIKTRENKLYYNNKLLKDN